MYGTQTHGGTPDGTNWFENDVKMYGTQTSIARMRIYEQFENDVKMYGTQTSPFRFILCNCLRMM